MSIRGGPGRTHREWVRRVCLLGLLVAGCGSAELGTEARADRGVDGGAAAAELDGAVMDGAVLSGDAAVVVGADSAVVGPDAGVEGADAAVEGADAAVEVPDAAEVRPDAAVAVPDAAIEPPDAARPGEPPPLNLADVTWLHTDVSGWRETARLESVTFRGAQICLNHDHADAWPNGDINGVVVAANPWVFIFEDGRWWGATWEWMRPGQTCKNQSSVAGDHIKRRPFDAASGWRPRSGQVLYFMVSGLARDAMRNAEERSNFVRVEWP